MAAPRFPKSLKILGILLIALDLLLVYLGTPLDLLDMKLAYPPEEVFRVLSDAGANGRQLYQAIAYLDLVLIGVYTSFFFGVVRYLSVPNVTTTLKNLARVLAFSMMAFDLVETIGSLVLLHHYPEMNPAVARMVATSTSLKWIACASFLFAVIFLANGASKYRHRF